MVRVMLIDTQGKKSYLQWDPVGQTDVESVQVSPGETIPASTAVEVAREVARGHVLGLTEGYRWYRQAG